MATNIPFPVTVLPAKPLSTAGLDTVFGVKDGAIVQQADVTFTPFQFGAVGDGVADDTAALTAMFAAVRATLPPVIYEYFRAVVDLNGGKYRITDTVNATGLQCWNLKIHGGVILAECAGKWAIDLSGSRGYIIDTVHVRGSSSSMPKGPFLCARATDHFSLCDNNTFLHVTCEGYFSVAAHYAYSQETTTHIHCHYWNSCPDGAVAILEGYDSHPQTSPYKTLLTGGHSFINCVYINCDFRYQPALAIDYGTITGISKANPAVVTCAAGHPFANGDQVIIAHVDTGMTQMRGKLATVSNVTSTTFEMTGVNSSSFSTWTAGGLAIRKMAGPAIYMSRMKQHRFIACYVVAYGEDAIELSFPDSVPNDVCSFDFLQEGAVSRSVFRFTNIGSSGPQLLRSCNFESFDTFSAGAYFSTDATVDGRVVLYGATIKVTSHIVLGGMPLVLASDAAKFAFYGANIQWPNRASVTPSSYTALKGKVFAIDDGDTYDYDEITTDARDGAFTPTITAGTGTITTLGTVTGFAKYQGDMVWVEYEINITTNGTGADYIQASLPANSISGAITTLNGRINASNGKQLQGLIHGSGGIVTVRNYDNGYPGGDGVQLFLSGWYRIA